ncbi:MAG: GHKL domain-containing protein [Nitrospirae bacterium]|nr:GHKL domain-containing protein [Nitrospirota bacterium]
MIDPTKKRLSIIFTSVIVIFNILIIILSYLFWHQSMVNSVKRHLMEDMKTEFLDQFNRSGIDFVRNMWDEHHFQILNRDGQIVVSTRNSVDFYPVLNRKLLKEAFGGVQAFEIVVVQDESHLVFYFPIDGNYVGRAAKSLAGEIRYDKAFIRLVAIVLPLMFFLSYLVSRYLVNHAMKPISDIFTFQETFSSNVSHELRSPLASLKGNFEVSLRKERSADEYKEVIVFGLRETDRIIKLLNNLSLLASSKFKKLDLYKNKVEINRLIKDQVSALAPSVHAKGIKLTISEIPGLACLCDEGLIRRTIENLLENAVKYTPEGGMINIDLSLVAGHISLTISNTCDSLKKEEFAYVFDPFYRGEKAVHMKMEGKGLGLYISRYIVRSHGGDIKLNNTESDLFSLTMFLPAK